LGDTCVVLAGVEQRNDEDDEDDDDEHDDADDGGVDCPRTMFGNDWIKLMLNRL
jgi:hypothetical protein